MTLDTAEGSIGFDPDDRLSMAEAYGLKRALEDRDFCSGLAKFFSSVAGYAQKQSARTLTEGAEKYHNALLWACEARAMEQLFSKLETFVSDQLNEQ